ncbi:MAG: autotransporter-associated beta strand repeat-containing protein [Chthoniobacterales bacterium]|nr:autotransporter-associated beta strand repeat-containing protein [Chthoniobacterales bacterium]
MKKPILIPVVFLLFLSLQAARAGSATWDLNPVNNDWNTAANWTPATVPNSVSDIATFDLSNTKSLRIASGDIVGGIVFDSGASAFIINLESFAFLTLGGGGISNASAVTQKFTVGSFAQLNFVNGAKAGMMTQITNIGATNDFGGEGTTYFRNSASADHAVVLNAGATGSAAPPGFTYFYDTSTADHATISNLPAALDADQGGSTYFYASASAGNGTFTNNGGTAAYLFATTTEFYDTSTAAEATLTATGGVHDFGQGGGTLFFASSTAANASLVATAGVNGHPGGYIWLADSSTGGTAQVRLMGNGQLDISVHDAPGVTIGSLKGNGLVFVGANNLTVGSNGLDGNFTGIIQDGGQDGGVGGSLTKTGAGVLNLRGANLYTGGTTVNEGALAALNTTGSATGTEAVQVNGGTLAGNGTIAGAATIGQGNGTGAFLAPANGTGVQSALTIQGKLTLKADATYICTLKAKLKKTSADEVIAEGVTINTGATFTFQGKVQGTLQAGTVFTVLSNTSSTPINGTFSNLPDGAILTMSGNNFQASYEGGDGNDLALTVVP